jgi:hypothetical protein
MQHACCATLGQEQTRRIRDFLQAHLSMRTCKLQGSTHAACILPWTRNRHAGLKTYKQNLQCAHACYKAAQHACSMHTTLDQDSSTHATYKAARTQPYTRNGHAGLLNAYRQILQCAHACYKAARMQHAYYLDQEQTRRITKLLQENPLMRARRSSCCCPFSKKLHKASLHSCCCCCLLKKLLREAG